MGGKEGSKQGEEKGAVEHCSADKLMQQSRLSQQHTPSLAQCRHQLAPIRGTGRPASAHKHHAKNKRDAH